MPLSLWITLGSLTGGAVAVCIAYLTLHKIEWTHDRARALISFAAGVLLAVSFLDLLPESFEEGGEPKAMLAYAFVGILLFFFVEKLLIWYHCHEEHCEVHTSSYMVMIGDTIHDFLDGIAIAVAFLVDVKLGFVTSIAVALHEIPQEIGDLAVLIAGGMKKKQALLFNILSALASLVGALLGYVFLSEIEGFVPSLVALTAGGFIYISAADLIPEIHHETRRRHIIWQFLIFLLGAAVVLALGTFVGE